MRGSVTATKERQQIVDEINRLKDKYKLSVHFCELGYEEGIYGYYISPRLFSYRVYEVKQGYKLVHYCTTKNETVALKRLLKVIQGKVGIMPEEMPEPELADTWEILPGGKEG